MIPYTVERRADTGVSNVTMGMWLFLASEVMLFGALFSSYALLRTSALSWPHGLDVLSLPIGSANTVILIAMSVLAWRAGRRPAGAGTLMLAGSSALALLFVALKAIEYRSEIVRGRVPSVNTFLAMYFVLTGLHALHVVAGLVANVWTITGLRRVSEAMTVGRLRALGLYWVFVDVVWLIIFVLMYLT
jgi:cytochrome c oxidase subunit 3